MRVQFTNVTLTATNVENEAIAYSRITAALDAIGIQYQTREITDYEETLPDGQSLDCDDTPKMTEQIRTATLSALGVR